jgi:hypothetical protein
MQHQAIAHHVLASAGSPTVGPILQTTLIMGFYPGHFLDFAKDYSFSAFAKDSIPGLPLSHTAVPDAAEEGGARRAG